MRSRIGCEVAFYAPRCVEREKGRWLRANALSSVSDASLIGRWLRFVSFQKVFRMLRRETVHSREKKWVQITKAIVRAPTSVKG